MTVPAVLLLLAKMNLAMGAAIALVWLLRRPLRARFGASIAYALWLLVPVAGVACLLPPRVVILPPVSAMQAAAPASPRGHVSHSALLLGQRRAGHDAVVLTMPKPMPKPMPVPKSVPKPWLPDPALLLFAAWVLGVLFMTWHLARLQFRFHAAMRLRQAGPAVLGFIRPRIVTPAGFETHFTIREQAAILAHEHVHLARQDARINALAALLRCLNWFNPLIHMGARWLCVDQELACDASVVRGAVSRRDYASALLKSQLMVASLPLGCNWPGAQHPLIERIAMLKHKPPGRLRRFAGVSLVLLAASFAGLGAWAAQPPIARTATVRPPRIVSAVLAAAPADDTQTVDTVDTNTSGSDVGASGNAHEVALIAPAPRMVHIVPATRSILAALPRMASISLVSAAAAAEAPPTESVTVTGSRRMYHDFSKTFATPTKITGKMARWERPICPRVVGQNSSYAAFITQRIKYVALAAGAPVNTDAACAPNIDIVFTTSPQALLDSVSNDDQQYLGYFTSVAQKKALATVSRPIQAWYATESTDFRGRRRPDIGRSIVSGSTVQNFNSAGDSATNSAGSALTDGPPFFYSTGNRLDDGIHTGFNHILIVIDSTRLAGQAVVPLSNYIAMLALTQINSPDACQELPSIVNKMASGCTHESSDSLTMYDLAYLQGLYQMNGSRNLTVQWGEIGDLMTDRLAKAK